MKEFAPKKKNIGDKKLYVNGLLANTQTHFNQNLTLSLVAPEHRAGKHTPYRGKKGTPGKHYT